MIFWVLLFVAVLAVLIFSVVGGLMEGVGGFFSGLGTSLMLVIPGFLFLGILGAGGFATGNATWEETSTEVRPLVALNTGSEIEGRSYFLGSGYVSESQVFSYVWGDDTTGYRLDSEYASSSTVFQDEANAPYLEVTHWERVPDTFWAPFTLTGGTDETYEFHIPAGSILSNYEVKP